MPQHRIRKQSAPQPGTGMRRAAAPLAALAALGAALVISAVASASTAAVPRVPGESLALPEYIGVLDYMGERSRTDRRPGHSYSYRAAGLALDVDVFDYGTTAALPNGIGSALLEREFTRLQEHLEGGGARLVHAGTVALGTKGLLAAREAVFVRHHATINGAKDFDGETYVWITAERGRLYEMHFDVHTGFEEDGEVSRSEALAALGSIIFHPVTPVAPTSAAAGQSLDVGIQWDPATPQDERKLWSAYLYTRAAFVAAQSESTQLSLGEHAASFQEEVRGRLIAAQLYRQLHGQDPASDSPYFAALDRVVTAGFLREYVWRYLRNSAWTQPPGLRLAAFDAWRAIHLRGHVPETYGHIVVRLAAAQDARHRGARPRETIAGS
ncbi:MAG: hypothetical protein ACRET2_06630 [Steroidobacteraceae bacterium]